MQKSSILFQISWVGFDTPVAVNIWAKNIAQAFSIAGFSSHIQYLSASKTEAFEVDGANNTGLPCFQSWMLGVPKIRNAVFAILRNREINKSRGYNFIAPLSGPYSVEHETEKAKVIRTGGAKYLHPVLEHPTVRTGISEKAELKKYMCRAANIYDVLMLITTYLFECNKDHGRIKPSLLNPIVVDSVTL